MDIACPNCSAAYRVPDALVFSRKPVRCAACGTRWVPDLPQEVTLGPAGPVPSGAPEARPATAIAEPAPPPEPPVAAESAWAPPPPAARSFGPAAPQAETEAAPRPAAMSIGPTPTEVVTEMVTETGALTPKPAVPPPLAETRWAPGAGPKGAPHRERGAALLPLAWAGSLLAVGGLLAGLALYRHDLAAAWPPFGWVVRLLGG
jgi:predicted Zn finger-like uncharacterized protein